MVKKSVAGLFLAFHSHFREFIEALNNSGVQYLLIGGYAVGAYGYIRGTGDLDIFINATEENAGAYKSKNLCSLINGISSCLQINLAKGRSNLACRGTADFFPATAFL